jgi:hypothetical protein
MERGNGPIPAIQAQTWSRREPGLKATEERKGEARHPTLRADRSPDYSTANFRCPAIRSRGFFTLHDTNLHAPPRTTMPDDREARGPHRADHESWGREASKRRLPPAAARCLLL